jgi:hypothetical protein
MQSIVAIQIKGMAGFVILLKAVTEYIYRTADS